jgi:hypothetical protein
MPNMPDNAPQEATYWPIEETIWMLVALKAFLKERVRIVQLAHSYSV